MSGVEQPDCQNPDSQTLEIVRGPFASLPQAGDESVSLEQLLRAYLKKKKKAQMELKRLTREFSEWLKIYPGKTRFNTMVGQKR